MGLAITFRRPAPLYRQMDCYACDQKSSQRCSRCGNRYCRGHGDDLCADCLDPVSAAPSSAVFRASLLGLLIASVLALWLLVRPPSLPGESSGVSQPLLPVASPASGGPTVTPSAGGVTPAPTAAPTPPPTPTPEGPLEYTVVENDTWYGIAGAYGVDAEALAAANGRTLEDFLQPGEVLVIPQ